MTDNESKQSSRTPEPEKPVVTLALEDRNRSKDFVSMFNSYNKEALCDALEALRTALRRSRVEYTRETTFAVQQIVENMIRKGPESLKKEHLITLINLFCADLNNLLAIANGPLPALRSVWARIINGVCLGFDEISRLVGLKLYAAVSSAWNQKMFPNVLLYPAVVEPGGRSRGFGDGSKSCYNLFITSGRRREMAELFFSESTLSPQVADMVPGAGAGLDVLDFEREAVRDVRYMAGLNACGAILSDTGLTQARIKSIVGKLDAAPFPQEMRKYPLQRAQIMAVTYYEYLTLINRGIMKDAVPGRPGDFGRYAARYMGCRFKAIDFGVFLPDYKGFTKTLTDENRASAIIRYVCGLLSPSSEGWLDLANFRLRYLCGDDILSRYAGYTGLFTPLAMSKQRSLRKADAPATDIFRSIDLWKDLTFPFVVHVIKAFCAMGLLKVAVDPMAGEADSMEGLRFVRMTLLGRYAFGFSDTYDEPAADTAEIPFELEDNLIVTVLDSKSPFIHFLDKIGERVGGNRYHITARGVVACSKDIAEAEAALRTLRQYVCPDPKGKWKEMLEETEARLKINFPVKTNYLLFILNGATPGLIQFINADREIAQKTLKVQNNSLLVESSYYEEFCEKLHKNGYLLQ